MRTLHKGLIIGGATLAVLIPAGLVAADQIGPGNMQGRGNGTMNQDCDHDPIQARDGTGAMHDANSAAATANGTAHGMGAQHRSGPMDGSGPRADRPMDGTGNQTRSGR